MAPMAAPASAPLSALFESPPTAAPSRPPMTAPVSAPLCVWLVELSLDGAFCVAQPAAQARARPTASVRTNGVMVFSLLLDDEDQVAHPTAGCRCPRDGDRLRLAGRVGHRPA